MVLRDLATGIPVRNHQYDEINSLIKNLFLICADPSWSKRKPVKHTFEDDLEQLIIKKNNNFTTVSILSASSENGKGKYIYHSYQSYPREIQYKLIYKYSTAFSPMV